jgi:ribosomal protein S18 acetylase RimI-like enzyme
MTARVIQGSFVGGGPRLPSPVVQPKAMPRLPGPPIPAFSGRPPVAQSKSAPRPPGPPAPAFAGRAPVAQPHGAGDAFSVDPGQLGLAASGGRPLPEAVRGKMEAALGADFSGVRVHVGPQAERIGAIAFTLGSDIYFAPGRFQPETAHGQQLLGHELAHVVQQRAGRVRNPLGLGLAVVQDHALEAEADRLGRHAATHRVAVQPKLPPSAVQPSSPVRISAPISAGPGSFRLTAGAGGRQVGSVMVHARDKASVEVTDLGVDPAHREHGIGKMLLASAARTGLQSGKSKVTLAAQDDGSERLTHWYKGMGFTQVGVNQRGYPRLEAPISRVLAGAVQRRDELFAKSNLTRSTPIPGASRDARGHLRAQVPTQPAPSRVAQRRFGPQIASSLHGTVQRMEQIPGFPGFYEGYLSQQQQKGTYNTVWSQPSTTDDFPVAHSSAKMGKGAQTHLVNFAEIQHLEDEENNHAEDRLAAYVQQQVAYQFRDSCPSGVVEYKIDQFYVSASPCTSEGNTSSKQRGCTENLIDWHENGLKLSTECGTVAVKITITKLVVHHLYKGNTYHGAEASYGALLRLKDAGAIGGWKIENMPRLNNFQGSQQM